MKKTLFLFVTCCCINLMIFAQPKPVKIAKNANIFTYEIYDYGTSIDTSTMEILLNYPVYQILSSENSGPFVPGYAHETTLVNLDMDSTFQQARFTGTDKAETYEVASAFSRSDIAYDTAQVNSLTCYTCHINSNTLEFFVQDYPYDINPIPYYGRFKGILVCFKRNNQTYIQLARTTFDKNAGKTIAANFMQGDVKRVSGRELSQIKKEKLIITTRIFDDEQICWGKTNDHIEDSHWGALNIPKDSVLHFAGGTLILKKISLPVLPRHYQTFVELHQRSNGDAYDRTGSVFVIPQGYFGQTFFDGINNHPDSLPIITGKDRQKYQGIAFKRWVEGESVLYYQPPVELMRFFTPFGVGHFNDRVKLDGLEWEDETYFKQEVTDLSGYLQGKEVLIGVWIGNYDGGGHKVTLDIKSYPGSNLWDDSSWEGDDEFCKSLFNTCNVLEMAGQNYGKLFATDSLTVTVDIPEAKSVKLRYISTGHGGWDGGDEFTPKANTILIDGKPAFTYTPWREDCGCYRRFNPVSGNFWNGMSSSDYSRSGWCPGTATQPVYFDLSYLKPGKHTITVAIPMGEPLGGSFSHWSVSGALIVSGE